MNKFISRKLIITIISLIIIIYMKISNSLSDTYFTISFLFIYFTYLFVQGVIDIKQLNIRTPIFEVKSDNNGNSTTKERLFDSENNNST
jgi:hypothetical protein